MNFAQRIFTLGSSDATGTQILEAQRDGIVRQIRQLDGTPDPRKSLAKRWADSVESWMQRTGVAADSIHYRRQSDAQDTAGTTGVAALRHMFAEVMREVHTVPTGLSLIPTNSSVPLGARSFAMRRLWITAQAQVWRGSQQNLPGTSWQQDEFESKIHYYITAVNWSAFEEMSDRVSGINMLRELMGEAREVLINFASDKTWFGDDEIGLPGILNHPYISRVVLSGPSSKAWSINEDTSSVDTEAYVDALVQFITRNYLASKGAFKPTKLVLPMNVLTFLKNRRIKRTNDSSDKSLLQAFFDQNPVITSESQIVLAHELQDAFGVGVSAIVALDDSPGTIENIIPGGGPQALPLVEQGFHSFMPTFMAHGGVLVKRVGNIQIGILDSEPA